MNIHASSASRSSVAPGVSASVPVEAGSICSPRRIRIGPSLPTAHTARPAPPWGKVAHRRSSRVSRLARAQLSQQRLGETGRQGLGVRCSCRAARYRHHGRGGRRGRGLWGREVYGRLPDERLHGVDGVTGGRRGQQLGGGVPQMRHAGAAHGGGPLVRLRGAGGGETWCGGAPSFVLVCGERSCAAAVASSRSQPARLGGSARGLSRLGA
jgi:hypothetical protein